MAVTVECSGRYLLIQRGTPPDQGLWSLPGGKVQWGETTLDAAKRELQEETKLLFNDDSSSSPSSSLHMIWYPSPFMTSDVIVRNSDDTTIHFHYLIAQCYAQVVHKMGTSTDQKDFDFDFEVVPPKVAAADDADDAKWWTIDEMLHNKELISKGVPEVIERAQFLVQQGVLVLK